MTFVEFSIVLTMASVEQVKYGNGNSVVSKWVLDEIDIVHVDSAFNAPSVFSAQRQDEMVRMHYGLNGDYNFSHRQLDKSFSGVGGRQNIMFSKGFQIEVESLTPKLETFGIRFTKELFVRLAEEATAPLQRFCDAILAGKSTLLSEQWPLIGQSTRRAIQEIQHCRYTGQMRNLFLLSKSIELLVLSAEAHGKLQNRSSAIIKSTGDKEKIMAARDLVVQEIQDPPHLSELAKRVGLNEYKLKVGFKEVFQMTVYGFIREQRFCLAQDYLRDTELRASEIAILLGYSSPQHFNNAFRKRFGRTPAAVRKNP